jgi:murein DD-endopeptidase MepM/ murein hydrolase activator NlpD
MMGSALLIMALAMSSETPGSDSAQDFSKRQRSATRRRLAEDKVRVRFLRKEEVSLLDGMRSIDESLVKSRARLLSLRKRKSELKLKRTSVAVALRTQAIAVEGVKWEVRQRLAAMHRLKRMPLLELKFDDEIKIRNRANHRRRIKDSLSLVFRYDAALIKELHERLKQTENLNQSMKDQEHRFLAHQLQLQAQTESDLLLQAQRDALLKGIRQERRLVERLRAEIGRSAKQIDRESKLMRGILPPPPPRPGGFSAQKGRLLWPLAGRVEVAFGKRVDPDSGLVMVHSGLDLRAPHGVSVSAVLGGKVMFAGRLSGYASVVIIEHGSRWHSVYGHLSGVNVETGQRVSRKTALGYVSDLDSTKGAYLYFELRKGGRAIDPLNWMSPG